MTDTRAGLREGDLFFALSGPNFDGADFAARAMEEGATLVLSSRSFEPPPGRAVVVVDDPLLALRRLASAARDALTGEVIAITGSNGKTLVKDLLVSALSASFRVWASPMSWNSRVGVPLSLIHADPAAAFVLIECGVSEPGEMALHAELVRPDRGIFVNVGDAHLQGFGSRERIATEKAILFEHTAIVYVPTGQPLIDAVLGDRVVHIPVQGDHLAIDKALALGVCEALGGDRAAAEKRLADWRPPSMRLEVSTTPHGVTLVNDAYTSDPESVIGALAVLARESGTGRSWAVLGGMAQQGDAFDRGVVRVARALRATGVHGLIGIGPGGRRIVEAARQEGLNEVVAAADVEQAAVAITERVRAGDAVLLKGSRPDRLERLAGLFFEGLAPAVLTVDLDQLMENFRRTSRVVHPAEVMPVVKAGAYGIDPVRVALALQHAGAPHFAVAYPDEGVLLRDRGITQPILVQNLVPAEIEKVVTHGLSSQVADLRLLEALGAEAERQRRRARVHIKVDTGMGRAGCLPEHVPELVHALVNHPWLVFDGLMTHFAAADEPAADAFTLGQIAMFDRVIEGLAVRPRWIHAANSAGLDRFPQSIYSMVRSGIGLWGYGERNGRVHAEPTLRLVTRVVSEKLLPEGHSVGYGRTWNTGARARRVAVVALGYADGYPRSLSNVGTMTVRGVSCPVVGRVCMDVTMLDVTEVGPLEPGEEVVVFGPGPNEPDLVALSIAAGTIPYEMLTRLSSRVRRVFESSL